MLVCIGTEDPLVPPDQRAAFEQEMRAGGVDWRMNLYGGAVHSFTNPAADGSNPAIEYDAVADARSWRAMLDLLTETFVAFLPFCPLIFPPLCELHRTERAAAVSWSPEPRCRAPLRRRRRAAGRRRHDRGWRRTRSVPSPCRPLASAASNVPDHAALGELDRAGVGRRHLVGAADVERDVVLPAAARPSIRSAADTSRDSGAEPAQVDDRHRPARSPPSSVVHVGVEADRIELRRRGPSPDRG